MPKRKLGLRFRRDKRGSLEGLPLYILIMVVIAAISLAAILAFMVYASPTIGMIKVGPIMSDNKLYNGTQTIVIDYQVTDEFYYRGVDWPHLNWKKDPNYSDHLDVTVVDKGGNAMAGVRVSVSGPNLTFAGTTNDKGYVLVPLDGLMVRSAIKGVTELVITARHKGTIGEDTATRTLDVIYQPKL